MNGFGATCDEEGWRAEKAKLGGAAVVKAGRSGQRYYSQTKGRRLHRPMNVP